MHTAIVLIVRNLYAGYFTSYYSVKVKEAAKTYVITTSE
jgi:ribosomal protein S17E